MSKLVATKSADPRFHNINLLGFASYLGTVKSLSASTEDSATIISPYIDKWGVKFLTDAWKQCQDEEPVWSIFVRKDNRCLVRSAEDFGWDVYSYRPLLEKKGEFGFHAKLVAVDERRAVIGSMNLIKRNLYSNLELGVEFDEPEMLWRTGRLVRSFRRVCEEII
ncbi:MAG: phospholipase D-like domain-containing protein [Candidatus Thorarchaeota archaeon]|jgi:phosphatidylserine/phosphatidylglycerophosphate/cardiolipin synthase-like enzyme